MQNIDKWRFWIRKNKRVTNSEGDYNIIDKNYLYFNDPNKEKD